MKEYMKGFIPYGIAALMISIVGGFATVLGPAFVKDMGLSYNNTTWTALATAMPAATCAPALGKLSDATGRRKALLIGMGIFTLGNALSALAPSLFFMLIARLVVGVGMAAIFPVVASYILTEFPQDKVGKGFSLYMLISSASVIFGPTLSGIIVDSLGWRAMLWLVSALCLILFFICLTFREENKPNRSAIRNFDIWGSVWVIIFFGLLLCLPSFGQNLGFGSAVFVFSLIFASIALIALIFTERRAKNPIIRGSFIKSRAFLLSVATLFLTQGLLQANMTNTIVFADYIQPDNSIISGIAISVMYIGMSLGALILGPLSDRFEPKYVLVFSLILTGIGCFAMRFYNESSSALQISLALGILGLGLGGNGTVLMKVALIGTPPEAAGSLTGTYGLFRDLSVPLGVAIFVPMFTNGITKLTYGRSAYTPAQAAVISMHRLSAIELIGVAIAIIAVLMLPKASASSNRHRK